MLSTVTDVFLPEYISFQSISACFLSKRNSRCSSGSLAPRLPLKWSTRICRLYIAPPHAPAADERLAFQVVPCVLPELIGSSLLYLAHVLIRRGEEPMTGSAVTN